MKIYMAVTADKYELPLAVSEDAGELARFCGITRGNVYVAVRKKCRLKKMNAVIVKLEVEDGEEID